MYQFGKYYYKVVHVNTLLLSSLPEQRLAAISADVVGCSTVCFPPFLIVAVGATSLLAWSPPVTTTSNSYRVFIVNPVVFFASRLGL